MSTAYIAVLENPPSSAHLCVDTHMAAYSDVQGLQQRTVRYYTWLHLPSLAHLVDSGCSSPVQTITQA